MAKFCGNPELLELMGEILQQAKDRSTKGVDTYKKAYKSLAACPMPYDHPSELVQLKDIGPGICDKLLKLLEAKCRREGRDPPELPHKKRKRKKNEQADGEDEDEDGPVVPAKKIKKKKAYVPALRSGGYALLLALAELQPDHEETLLKKELISVAQKHCDSSFTLPPNPNSFYTAWASMKTLTNNELVMERGIPKRYSLTEEGWAVAKLINQAHDPAKGRKDTFNFRQANDAGPSDSDDVPKEVQDSPSKSKYRDLVPYGHAERPLPSFKHITLPRGSFSVELVLDNREVFSKKDRDHIQKELAQKGITPITRALALGDILWVAKVTSPALVSQLQLDSSEIVLSHIIERKRLDDLVHSIKDGRFKEQKFRLRKSGVENVIYIIEEGGRSADSVRGYQEAVNSAIAGSQIVDGFFVHKTKTMNDTIAYLIRVTKYLKKAFENDELRIIPTEVLTATNYLPLRKKLADEHPTKQYFITYDAFASLSSKSSTLTLKDIFLKMLMCTRGVSGEKAIAIQKKWTTPKALMDAYRACGEGEEGTKKQKALVQEAMKTQVGRKKIGAAQSAKIAEIWGSMGIV